MFRQSGMRRLRWLVCGTALMVVQAGCQFGKYTAELKTEHFLPRLHLSKLPPQWEPPVEPEGSEVPGPGSERDAASD